MAKKRREKQIKRPKSKAAKPAPRGPTLQFALGGGQTGFTSTGLTGFQDLEPAAVVRELVQNSMDAAIEAGEEPARILFRVRDLKTSSIPGIGEYRLAFDQAVKSQKKLRNGKLRNHTKAVVRAINACLEKDTCEVLSVLDNGIGLNPKRMRALLGDGMSIKESGATGAFGNGHVVAIPASDLRYVLYGGVIGNGQRVGSGHTVLAAREGQNGRANLSKDGFLVKKLRNDLYDPYVFATGDEIPSLLAEEIEMIREKWSHGAAVIIPGFNYFREDRTTLWDAISQAAAKNFFPAIYEERLIIEIEESGESKRLDSKSIGDVLENCRQEKRARRFLSGSRAYEALQTMKAGKILNVKTKIGPATLRLRHPIESGITQVDLCRNGMWITNSPPMLQNHNFANCRAFHCLILLDPQSGDLHTLASNTEGPLHNDMILKSLQPDEKRELRGALGEIRTELKKQVPELDTASFRPDDIFVVGTHGITQGGTRPSFAGSPTIIRRRPHTDPPEPRPTPPGPTPTPRPPRPKKPLTFQALPIQTGPRSCVVEILPSENCSESEFRLALDESLDPTCDSRDKEAYMILSNAKINGKVVPSGRLVSGKEGQILGIRLGDLEEGQRQIIEVDYAPSVDIPISQDQRVVFQVEMLSYSENESQPEEE